jgi:hypothetical protein
MDSLDLVNLTKQEYIEDQILNIDGYIEDLDRLSNLNCSDKYRDFKNNIIVLYKLFLEKAKRKKRKIPKWKYDKDGVILKPVPDVTENYIRIRIRNPGTMVDGSFRTITISESQGIKAVIGKLKSDPNGPTKIQSVLFDKNKWTVDRAVKWVREHKESLKDLSSKDFINNVFGGNNE